MNKKNWFVRHWIISIFLGIILIGIISGITNGNTAENNTDPVEIPVEIPVENVMDKTSGFTMDNCYEICEGYPMEINTIICQGNCDMYGKPSSKLDTYCLASIESVKNSQ